MTVKIGDRVHFDTDNEEWGRVASDGIVLDIFDDTALIQAETIRANIIVLLEDIANEP